MQQMETATTPSRVCSKCGTRIFGDAPGGLCSVCLFRTGLGSIEDSDAAGLERDRMQMQFGEYDLIEEIGRGGQGVVYRARQKSLNRTVALKVIGLGQWSSTPHLKRFRHEAEAAASLEHPQIVPIYEIGERDGSCYFSMKFIEGGQLDDVLKREPMAPRRAAELLVKIARTVHFAHERGILHRDIKPGNILLDRHGEPHLTDFGLARLIEQESTITNSFDVLGTPSYMSPEQAAGRTKELGAAADVYSLGAVFYQMLTGQPPFAGGTTYETIRLVMETEPRDPRLWNSKVDVDLATICLKCLEKDSSRRYGTAGALADDVDRWLRHEPIQARRTGIVVRGKKWLRRNPATAIAAGSMAALVFAVAVIIWKSELFRERPTSAVVASEKSIAVLPFANLSDDKSNAYFASGIQDEILSRLSKIAELKVISRTSTEKYKSSPPNLREVGQQLAVANILEGRVQKSGDQVRIMVQLINSSTDSHVWAETYDRKLTDMFTVESEVAQKIASSLQAKLTGFEQMAISMRPTENTEAYRLYLKGRFFWNKRTGGDLKTAAKYFEEAIEADPGYANAYAGLAQADLLMPYYNAASEDFFQKAKIAATRAIALDETSPEGHAALAMLLCYDFKFRESEREFKRAIELDPNYATAHHWYGNTFLTSMGRFDEAIKEGKRAVELDPFSLIINADLGSTLMLARRYDEAIAQLRATLSLDSNFAYTHVTLGTVLLLKGDVSAAISQYETARKLNESCDVLALLSRAYAEEARTTDAVQTFHDLEQCAQKQYVRSHVWAVAYIALGDHETAINYLEKYRDNWLKINPLLDPLRNEPRFQKLVAKHFPEPGP
jgi:serine/threonine protein kinase/Tfp pilus assembly protein PilF